MYKESLLVEIHEPLFLAKSLRVYIKRDDLINPAPAGNKWRKLKYNLQQAQSEKQNTLLTFGGAFSNHIYATAAAARRFGFQAIGLIRGERHATLNPTLQFAEAQGMELHFIDRTTYRAWTKSLPVAEIQAKYGKVYILPEGGTNALALKGCAEIVSATQQQLPNQKIDYWAVASGTGGTISGIIEGTKGAGQVLGFSALKGDFLKEAVTQLLNEYTNTNPTNWEMCTDYHFGGYARFKPALIEFIQTFKAKHNILLDPIYTAKLFYGLYDLIAKDYFKKGSTIVGIHTGGLQGIAGFNARFGLEL